MSATILPQKSIVRPAGFTLIEMLVVITIIVLMVSLGVSSFKGGSALDATRAASVVAAGEFDSARNEAIMRQTSTRVIVDTAWVLGRSDLADHYLRRMTVAYLDPQSGNWVQSGAWTVLPSNTYFDINYSVLHGTDMTVNFAGPNAPTTGYAYYQFNPTGQTPASPFSIFAPAGSTSTAASLAQCIISVGTVNPATGIFQERGRGSANANAAPGTCYGFVLYRMGHMTFFRSNSEIQQSS